MITKVNHVGVVVKDMQEELKNYEKIFGLKPAVLKDAMDGRLRVAFVRPPGGEIELLQPLDMSISFGKFLQSHGPGIHHYALETDDIEAEVERMKKAGVAFDTEKPRIGAHGVKIIFTKPETTMGLNIELCEAPK
jgi:methylmalonyl-CoA epimerase